MFCPHETLAKAGDATFRSGEKIHSKKEFLTLYQRGTRSYSRYFIIITHKNPSGQRRIGITVSKKVGNAVRRNRTKRLIREYFRLHKTLFSESQDIVIIGKKKIPYLSYQDVCNELAGLVSSKAI